jgi:hypothetical protein
MKRNNKSRLSKIALAVITLGILISCESVIDLDLSDTSPKNVIEAVITDQPGPYSVKLSQSTDFYAPGVYQTISDAIIKISDDTGFIEILTETDEPGLYLTDHLIGTPGMLYNITVEIADITYYAESRMPVPVILDSVRYEYKVNNSPNPDESDYTLHFYFQDSPEIDNFYRFKISRNEVLKDDIILMDDEFFDGMYIDYSIDKIDSLNTGDLINVELLTINEDNYNYYSSLTDALAGGGNFISSDAPANPQTNLNNNALGYFGTYSITKAEVLLGN